jgi:hypothetical protein
MRPILVVLTLLIVSLVLSACNLPGQAPNNAGVQATSAAQTVQAELTVAATATATQGTANGLLATPTLISQPAPVTPTPTACDDSATNTAWDRDNAPYDVKAVNTALAPDKPFLVSWTFQNTGGCTWDNSYQMAFESGTSLTDSPSFHILQPGQTVPPGQTVTVNVEMTTPADAGDYQAAWQLQNSQGEALMSFSLLLKVGSAATASLARPGGLTYTYECNTGAINVTLSWTDVADNEDGYRIYRDGNKVADLAADSTSYTETVPGSGTYTYKIAAFNAAGESPSEISVATTNCK